jgi:hypothetical protein
MTAAEWEAVALEWGLPRYRGRQVFDAIHVQGLRGYDAMRVLPGPLRERLGRELPIRLPEIARSEPSSDGSIKYGLKLSDGALIEAVFMPGEAWRAAVNEFEDARAVHQESPRSKVEGLRSARSPEFEIGNRESEIYGLSFFADGMRGGLRVLRYGEIGRGTESLGGGDRGTALRGPR